MREGRTYDLLRKSALRMVDFILAFSNFTGRGSGLPSVEPAGRVSHNPATYLYGAYLATSELIHFGSFSFILKNELE